jgi:heat shock protein HslJ
MRRSFLLVAVLGLTLLACAEPSEPAASDPTGSAWVLESGTLDGAAIPIVDDHPITLTFDPDLEQAGGVSACNNYFGGYTISGGEISFSDLGHTMMACEPEEVMDSETKYLGAMALVDGFTATDDTLTLTGDGVELVFVVDPNASS